MTGRQKQRRSEWLGQLFCILLLLALLATMLFTESARAKGSMSYERIVRASFTVSDSLSGFVLRDETLLDSQNTGAVTYTVQTNTPVTSQTVVAKVWNNDTGTDERASASALSAQIEKRRAVLAEYEQSWQTDYLTSYAALMQALGNGSIKGACGTVTALADTLVRRDAEQAEIAERLREEIAALELQFEELIRHEDDPDTVRAGVDGIFCRDTDGYETALGTAHAGLLTPSGLSLLLADSTVPSPVIGRVVDPTVWYLAVPAPTDVAATYLEGACHTVHFADSLASAELTVERIVVEGDTALLLLRGTDLPPALLSGRRHSVRIERETVTGLRVPAAAIYDGNTVYVEENGVARARTVTPVLWQNGCVLLSPDEGSLREDERVLISVRRIYDGKAVS